MSDYWEAMVIKKIDMFQDDEDVPAVADHPTRATAPLNALTDSLNDKVMYSDS